MAKEFSRAFYDSPAWRKCRKSYISKRQSIDGGMCEHCKQEIGYIVDHIEELTPDNINDPYITLNHENLQFLCLPCHNTKHFGKDTEVIRDELMFDKDGNIVKKMV